MRHYLLILTLFAILAAGAQSGGTDIDPDNFDNQKLEKILFDKVNAYRKSQAKLPLRYNPMVKKVASDQCDYLKDKKELTHEQPEANKRTVLDRFKFHTKVTKASVGENLIELYVLKRLSFPDPKTGKVLTTTITTYEEAADMMLNFWKSSSFHNQNMLSDKFEMGAISVNYDPATKRVIGVQVFAKVGG